ncbi:MAG TPA: S8 family serine peptidase, partial [Chitinophagaceae bacterium]|nr:S8 family serine peptidase [Chitinophagaceae bacterium]
MMRCLLWKFTFILFIILIAEVRSVHSQELNSRFSDSLFQLYAETTTPVSLERPYYIIDWQGQQPPGIKIIRQLGEKTAIISLTDSLVFQPLKQKIHISPANDKWKLSSSVFEKLPSDNETAFILVATDMTELLRLLKVLINDLVIIREDSPSNSIVIKASVAFIKEKILPLAQVVFIDRLAAAVPEVSIIGYNRSFHGINALDYSLPGANGKNIVAGVKEQKMQEADIDLVKRVVASPIAATNTTSHATVISSIIGGAGNSFYDGRGIAPAAKFFPSTFDNLFADNTGTLTAGNVTVQNHSYGTVIQQFYGAEAVSYDAQAWQNKNLLHIFSAGNRGTEAAADGRYANIPGYANLTGNFKMAKNILTIGAIDNKGIIPAESSAGPLYDGRLAPQLIALGPNGTSDAAAMVTGTIAVMQQVFADSNSQQIPPASLIKAILFNTADDVHTAGIDFKTGFGLLNSFEAVKAVQQKKYDGGSVVQGQQWTRNITIPAGTAQLKVTLCWTDTTAQVNNNKALINDLDLEVVQLSNGTVYKPWVLSTVAAADSLAKLPVRKRDSLNTAEQVSIWLPATGNYQVRVTGTLINNSPIPFHVTLQTDTMNNFRFTSPQHTSDINRQENSNLDIRWRTFVADTNTTGNLYISYNSGNTWEMIKPSHKIYTNYFSWPIKDTSSRALFRMETGFGNFYSNEVVISKVIRPVIDFFCTDSLGISWNRHIYASGYRIYGLIDSPYLKPLFTVTDTFTVLKRSIYPQQVFAVEPVLSNGLPAARSVAFNINFQGTKCFYRTLYHTLLDGNLLDLVLELSAPSYVDS